MSLSFANLRQILKYRYLLSAFLLAVALFTIFFLVKHFHDGSQCCRLERHSTWQAFEGTWEQDDDLIRNTSNARGAKLMTGSTAWTDYAIEADIRLLGEFGYAGLIIRSTGEEKGVDAYHGYTAGLSDGDDSLFLGRADFGWRPFVHKAILPRVYAGRWYHMKLMSVHCSIAVTLADEWGHVTSVAVEDKGCLDSGRFGLKSFGTGAEWRNVTTHPASENDLKAILNGAAIPLAGAEESVPGAAASTNEQFLEPILRDISQFELGADALPISELRHLDPNRPQHVTVHGSVTLITPTIFIQDSTGGIAIPKSSPTPPLEIGDEISATGDAEVNDFGSVLQRAQIRRLWSHAPVIPVSVTSLQASQGTYENQFIEVSGRLVGEVTSSDGSVVLNLDDGSQSFVAVARPGDGGDALRDLKKFSRLSLRGICRLDPKDTGQMAAFAILLPSVDEVIVLDDPPFWNTEHVAMLASGSVLVIFTSFVGFVLIQQWRFDAVLEERDRLAHEMHDSLAQSFAGIGFQLEAISSEFGVESSFAHQIDAALKMARSSHEEARNSIAALRPESLGSMGLAHALESCARRLTEGLASISIRTITTGTERALPLRVSDTLIRIGFEAIANAISHGSPKTLTISINYMKGALECIIADDGAGFTVSSKSAGFGIRGMGKRADSISAKLLIQSGSGIGTSVKVRVPLTATVFEKISQRLDRLRSHARSHDKQPYR